MFDFFKDAYLESKGVDVAAAKAQQREQERRARLSYYIFSPKSRTTVYVIALLFCVVAGLGIYQLSSAVPAPADALPRLLRYILQLLLALGVCACLIVSSFLLADVEVESKKDIPSAIKRLELTAAIGIVIFVVITMFAGLLAPMMAA